MIHYIYDGSFDGLLTIIFETYAQQERPDSIGDSLSSLLIMDTRQIPTDKEKAARVRNKLEAICGKQGLRLLYKCFLSEKKVREMQIYRFVERMVRERRNILHDYRDPIIVEMQRTAKQVDREVHRMHAFVRFQETTDGKFMALINPDFYVIPLIGAHFRKRYPGFEWVIYDIRRKVGIRHNEGKVQRLNGDANTRVKLEPDELTEKERLMQHLWRTYFEHVNIAERRNDRLHQQHIPKRYWPLLTEKSGGFDG